MILHTWRAVENSQKDQCHFHGERYRFVERIFNGPIPRVAFCQGVHVKFAAAGIVDQPFVELIGPAASEVERDRVVRHPPFVVIIGPGGADGNDISAVTAQLPL